LDLPDYEKHIKTRSTLPSIKKRKRYDSLLFQNLKLRADLAYAKKKVDKVKRKRSELASSSSEVIGKLDSALSDAFNPKYRPEPPVRAAFPELPSFVFGAGAGDFQRVAPPRTSRRGR
jgi:hypothetical protein